MYFYAVFFFFFFFFFCCMKDLTKRDFKSNDVSHITLSHLLDVCFLVSSNENKFKVLPGTEPGPFAQELLTTVPFSFNFFNTKLERQRNHLLTLTCSPHLLSQNSLQFLYHYSSTLNYSRNHGRYDLLYVVPSLVVDEVLK